MDHHRRLAAWRCGLGVLALALVLAAGGPTVAAAQAPPAGRVWISPDLPADHWAVAAARRAEALGLVQGHLPAQQRVPRHVVARRIREAAERAATAAPEYAALTSAWAARMADEFPALEVAGDATVRSLGQSAGLAYVSHRGRAQPGVGLPWDGTGARYLPPVSAVEGDAALTVGLGPYLSALAEPLVSTDGAALQGWDVSAGWRGVALAVGHQPIGYGYARSGSLVLSGREPVTRLQVQTVEPVRLPGPLRVLGLVAVHGFGGLLDEPRHPGDPYIWGATLRVQPHPRFTASIHRASIIGGDSVDTPLTARTFFRTLIGHNLLGFENEVVAGELRYRLPTERFLPLTVYTEWGAEDAAGAWRDVPGRLYGVEVPAVPRLPELAVGVEYVSFAGSCCGNPPWYRHAPHRGGWVTDERPMGHPLGGQGRQVSLLTRLDLAGSRVRLDAHGFLRRRDAENLFVPGRAGRSRGIELNGAAQLHPWLEVTVGLVAERGDGWMEDRAVLGLRTDF